MIRILYVTQTHLNLILNSTQSHAAEREKDLAKTMIQKMQNQKQKVAKNIQIILIGY